MNKLLFAVLLTAALFCCFISCVPMSYSYSKMEKDEFKVQRHAMVKTQIMQRGIKDNRVLAAMLEVERHMFIPQEMREYAYLDNALPIEKNQTISQPYIVALMSELACIKPDDRVLEIGTGSGYQAAILSKLAKKVYSIEIIKELADKAKERLKKLGYENIEIKCADGYLGWPQEAPFDAIIVTAAAPDIPEELVKQLKTGGRMVIPLGDIFQELYVITKNEDGTIKKEHIIPVRFVPMIKGS